MSVGIHVNMCSNTEDFTVYSRLTPAYACYISSSFRLLLVSYIISHKWQERNFNKSTCFFKIIYRLNYILKSGHIRWMDIVKATANILLLKWMSVLGVVSGHHSHSNTEWKRIRVRSVARNCQSEQHSGVTKPCYLLQTAEDRREVQHMKPGLV